MMDETTFWGIIETSRQTAAGKKRPASQDFMDVHERTLADELRTLPPGEIAAFDERFNHFHDLAYRWDLWAAAYWLHGGCSDDGFIDFRSCLISLGRELYDRVLNDPDSLADIAGGKDVPYMQSEGFQYVASKVYKEKTNQEMPPSERHDSAPLEPVGEQIDHDDPKVMAERFPKLVAKYPDMGD